MSDEDLKKLRHEVTPAPCACGHGDHAWRVCYKQLSPPVEDGNDYDSGTYCNCGARRPDQPATVVLAILDELAAARERIARLEAAVDSVANNMECDGIAFERDCISAGLSPPCPVCECVASRKETPDAK